ncbi:helix-turn-helix transcriptional regulator [Herbiconiux solani]|uniref:helix-turn-helix transcriptional regulator n=1 Tax=Herbiconiux solani TaxID=661329 RepID=UPI000825E768|nr:helix-turn-helix transcriptional regulator [Herbiconiux solani]
MGSSSNQLGDFLRARREQVQPEEVGLPRGPGRRVPGLRREEVASLAGISPDYYLRIEQGRDRRPSDQVVRALARALRIDSSGRTYLLRLARPRPYLQAVTRDYSVSDGVLQLLNQWSHTPAYVTDANLDVLASNGLGRLIAPGFHVPGTNLIEMAFEHYGITMADIAMLDDDESQTIRRDWEQVLREMISSLRFQGDPDDPRFQEIVGRLSTRHLIFRRVWGEHAAQPQTGGVKRVDIAPFGWVDFRWQTLEIPRPGRQYLTTFSGEPGSQAAAAIAYLSARLQAGRSESAVSPSARSADRDDESPEPRTITVS